MTYEEILKDLCEIIVARSQQKEAIVRQESMVEIEKIAKEILEIG